MLEAECRLVSNCDVLHTASLPLSDGMAATAFGMHDMEAPFCFCYCQQFQRQKCILRFQRERLFDKSNKLSLFPSKKQLQRQNGKLFGSFFFFICLYQKISLFLIQTCDQYSHLEKVANFANANKSALKCILQNSKRPSKAFGLVQNQIAYFVKTKL